MTTLEDRTATALLVIDVQRDVVASAHRRDEVVAHVVDLVDRARTAGTPVVWVQHHEPEGLVRGSAGWAYVEELSPGDTEPLVHKTYADSFEDTDLEQVLAGLGVGSLVVCGAQSDECIRATLHGAIVRGYDALLVADAHTTEDDLGVVSGAQAVALTNQYWHGHRAPGRTAGTLDTADVLFG